MRKLAVLTAAMALIAFAATPASAADEAAGLVGSSVKPTGVTTVSWDSSFKDLSFTEGNTSTFTVNWTVDVGEAVFDSCGSKTHKGKGKGGTFTPKSGKDPVTGSTTCILDNDSEDGAGAVVVRVTFDTLHCDKIRGVEVGNGHVKLYLDVDTDGFGGTDTLVGYGVNVHVEDPNNAACP